MTEGLFILILSVILIASITKPSQNQLPYQIIPLTLAAGVMMVFLFKILKLLCVKLPFFATTKCFVILSVIYGALLVIVSLTNRNSPASFYDYEICYNSAMEYAKTGNVSYPMYFSMYPYNWKCTLVLSWIMKLSAVLGMNDPYFMILVANLIIIFSALYSCRYLLNAFFPEEKYLSLMLLACFVTCLPIYAYAQTFYSDGASFGGAVTGLALIHYAIERIKRKPVRTITLFVSGAILAFGAFMKITSLIVVVAAILYYFFMDLSAGTHKKHVHPLKAALASAVFIAFGFITIYFIGNAIFNQSDWYADSEIFNTPVISWIAMGLKENGTYFENREFKQYLDSLVYSDAKTEYSVEFIKENLYYFVNPDHLVRKIRANYASGVLGASDFAYYGYEKDTILSRVFHPYGDLYWNGSKYCMIWMFQIYLIMLIGAVGNLFRKGKHTCAPLMISELTFIGYFLFLMVWEANNRQLYNMLPIMLIGYVIMLKRMLRKDR